ncbi:MAG: hypothetical protein MR600_05760 [Subdoligranulum sp.]|nr:hypothetical protein [Subdoligranulum sp.]
MDDTKIIDSLLADPGAGMQLLLAQYGGLINAIIRRVLPNSPEDAEECAADVLVAAWQNAPKLPAENAQSITFTPVYHKGEYQYETRTVTTAEMQQGVKIATSDVGGYTLQNFKAQGQALTWQAVPYGFSVHNPEFFPQDEAYIDTNSNSYALVSSQVDPTTGIISYRQDYYTADPAQVAKISEFRYTFSTGYIADESKAITLPLVK